MRMIPAALAALMLAGAAAPAMAANARHPYRNVDRRVDKGGPTGDDQVDRLNQQQLDQARGQAPAGSGTMGSGTMGSTMGSPMAQPSMPARPMGQ